MRELKAGIIGVGFVGRAHLEALRRLGIEVVALAGRDPERAKGIAESYGVPKAYHDYEAFIGDEEIEVVHICTPNYLHFPMARGAIEVGKHVICEKPLAITSQESSTLVSLAKERGVVNAVNFNLRFYPLCHEAKALVERGYLGQVRIVHGSYLQDWLFLDTDWNWRLVPEEGGHLRAVADIGSHWLDLVSFITGLRVERVMADLATFIPIRKKPKRPVDTFAGRELTPEEYEERPIETEDYASILLSFSQGARGTLTVSQVSAGRKNRLFFQIDGSRASLAWNSERPNEMWLGHREEANKLLLKDPSLFSPQAKACADYPGGHSEGYPDTFKQLFKAVYTYISTGNYQAEPDFPTFLNGHRMLLLEEAILASWREGRWTPVSPSPALREE